MYAAAISEMTCWADVAQGRKKGSGTFSLVHFPFPFPFPFPLLVVQFFLGRPRGFGMTSLPSMAEICCAKRVEPNVTFCCVASRSWQVTAASSSLRTNAR